MELIAGLALLLLLAVVPVLAFSAHAQAGGRCGPADAGGIPCEPGSGASDRRVGGESRGPARAAPMDPSPSIDTLDAPAPEFLEADGEVVFRIPED